MTHGHKQEITPTITNQSICIPISHSYQENLYLEIHRTSNKILNQDLEKIQKYLSIVHFFIRISCVMCSTTIESNVLYFDFFQKYLKPLTLNYEQITLRDNNYIYYVDTLFDDETPKTTIEIGHFPAVNSLPKFQQTIRLNDFAKYKWKNKAALIKKVKTQQNFQ